MGWSPLLVYRCIASSERAISNITSAATTPQPNHLTTTRSQALSLLCSVRSARKVKVPKEKQRDKSSATVALRTHHKNVVLSPASRDELRRTTSSQVPAQAALQPSDHFVGSRTPKRTRGAIHVRNRYQHHCLKLRVLYLQRIWRKASHSRGR